MLLHRVLPSVGLLAMNIHSTSSTTVKYLMILNRKLFIQPNFVHVPKIPFGCFALSSRNIYITNSKNASTRYVNIKEGIFKRAWKKIKYYTVEKTRKKVIGYYLYESIADKINYLPFFKDMDMPDTFNSWFLVTELHVWMLMVKAMEMSDDGRLLRNFIVEAMWEDVSMKGKKLGPENITAVKEQVLVLGDQFQAALIAYDEGLLSNDKVLASAIWRRFFDRSCDNPERLETMVRYVRKQVQSLDNLSEDDFKNRNITWLPLEQRKD